MKEFLDLIPLERVHPYRTYVCTHRLVPNDLTIYPLILGNLGNPYDIQMILSPWLVTANYSSLSSLETNLKNLTSIRIIRTITSSDRVDIWFNFHSSSLLSIFNHQNQNREA